MREPQILGSEGRRTVVRLPDEAYSDSPPPDDSSVLARVAPDGVDVYVSPAVRRLIDQRHPLFVDSRLLARASLVAATRSQYIWDVDVAIAAGADPTEEGVAAWRREQRVPRPPAPWPAAWDRGAPRDRLLALVERFRAGLD